MFYVHYTNENHEWCLKVVFLFHSLKQGFTKLSHLSYISITKKVHFGTVQCTADHDQSHDMM